MKELRKKKGEKMNNKKQYYYNLTASIHTFSVKSNNSPNIPLLADIETIRSCYMEKTQLWITRINPNKIKGDILSYSEFCAVTNILFEKMGISNCTYWRTDIRLDSYDDNFKEYYKLNLLLINLFSMVFNDPNGQAISHMLTQTKEFSDVSAKNQYWEVKYYNKKFQTNDEDPAKARLEFRSLKSTNIDGHPPHEIKNMWLEKLDDLPKLYDKLQEQCNNELANAYKIYLEYNHKSNANRDLLTNFFKSNSNTMTVFTRKQLKKFLLICGVSESSVNDRVDYICMNTNIEFFSKKDLSNYIELIKNSMDDFFSS